MSQRIGSHQTLRNLLVAAVNQPDAEGILRAASRLTVEDLQLLEAAAEGHRIRPAVHRLLKRTRLPDARIRGFAASAAQQNMRHLRTLADLAHISAVLSGSPVPWVVAKGPVASACEWPAADMREYYDLDIYVDPSAFPAAVDLLTASGCVGVDVNWPEMRKLMRAEYAMRGPFGTMLDVHWDIAVRPELRDAFVTDTAAMISRARMVQLGTGFFPTFDPVDSVILLGFHAAQAGANRLMWLGDIWYAVQDPAFSWPEFDSRARRSRTLLPISIVLERARRVLGHTADGSQSGVWQAPGPWGRLVRWYDQRQPQVFIPGDFHAGAGPVGAARPTLPASLAAAVRGRHEIRKGEREVLRSGKQYNPLDLDVPDPIARAAYMRAAATGSHR